MIKKISIEDLENFNKLGLQVNKKFDKVFDLESIISSLYESLYGFYLDNNLVGFIHINKLYETIDIINIVVDNNYRQKGIASSLINYIIDINGDVKNIMLEVNEKNYAAINLYKKFNFKIISGRNNYYGEDNALVMKRDDNNERS